MDRRWLGMLLLVAAVLSALVAQGVTGHLVAGSPRVTVVPGAPQVGDCVAAITALPAVDENTDPDSPISYPSARYGCGPTVLGEVMSVDGTAHPLSAATVTGYQRAGSACELSEVNYVGSIGPFDPASLNTPTIGWQADVVVQSVSVGPDPLQRAAGQSWTACLGTTAYQHRYSGRLAGALDGGVLPPEFATCWKFLTSPTEQQVNDPEVSCRTPHPVEVLAQSEIFGLVTTPAQLQRTCLGMASRAMRTTDPTRGGRLHIAAYLGTATGAAPLVRIDQQDGWAVCIAAVDPPLRLTNTVIGIGNQPLPVG